MSDVCKLRGYVSSRPFLGERVPQHVQNLVIRDYCGKAGFPYLLSSTEYAMPGCFIILRQLMNELTRGNGIATYSLFMLPKAAYQRLQIYTSIINSGASLHAALEGLSIYTSDDIERVEDLWSVQKIMHLCPQSVIMK